MPLKKPVEVPKLPKTRKKNAETAKKAIPAKKSDKIEYVCFPFFKFDDVLGKQYTAIRIQTINEFTSFAYELSISASLDKNVIDIVILGLQTKMNYLPKVEPARADALFDNLTGDFTVNVIKQDGSINSAEFHFNIYKKEIILTKKFLPEKKNNRLFCDFAVDEALFSFVKE